MSELKINNARNSADSATALRDRIVEYGKLAQSNFADGHYMLSIDYCRLLSEIAFALKKDDLAAEAYHLWCLSCLKMSKLDEAAVVCQTAKTRLGDYLDLAYFELLIAALNSEVVKIPDLAQRYNTLYDSGPQDPSKTKNSGKLGEVLLMWEQAAEQLGNTSDAIQLIEKYLELYPEDANIVEHLNQLRRAGENHTTGRDNGKEKK
jgi:tetratricopeptide (TPR) repeat protein